MANRFTDSRKWDDDWFIDLPPEFKLMWIYILDKCNHAGIYKHSEKLTDVLVGKIDLPTFLTRCNGRILKLEQNKYFIPKFIEFQYKLPAEKLDPDNRCHKSVLGILTSEGAIKPLISPLQGCKDKVKVKDKDSFNITDSHFNELWQKYPVKDGRKAALRFFKASVLTEQDLVDIWNALENYLKSDKVVKGYVKNGSTWFNNWKDWLEIKEANPYEDVK